MCRNKIRLEKLFKKTVSSTIQRDELDSLKKVCYEYVDNEEVAIFTVQTNGQNRTCTWVQNNIALENRNKGLCYNNNTKIFAIILESPHKKEFEKNRNDKNGNHPALGSTGRNINQHFLNYLNKFRVCSFQNNISKLNFTELIKDGEYKLVLINLINFQCSLGEKPKKYRDIIINKIMENIKFSKHFISEIERFNPNIILNACTSKYAAFVKDLLCKELKLDFLLLNSHHPSSWIDDNSCFSLEKSSK